VTGAELPAVLPRPPLPPGPYLVAGAARAGFAAVARLHLLGENIAAWDGLEWPGPERVLAAFRSEGIRTYAGGDGREALSAEPRPRCVIKSPGIAFDHPLVASALDAGIPVLDELEFGWRLESRPVVAVTGTNGKSTVSSLIETTLRAAGCDPVLAGNTTFGHPLSGVGDEPGDVVVCEVSSFQLEGCPGFVPEIGVLTNVTTDHLYRHADFAEYERLKRSMFVRERPCTATALNAEDPTAAALAIELPDRGARVATFGHSEEARWRIEARELHGERTRLSVRGPSGPVRLASRLPGRHNAANVSAALAAAELCSVDPEVAVEAIESFPGLPGRFEPIPSPPDGAAVIVDYAHNPAGVECALEAARELASRRGGGLIAVVSVLSVYDPELSAAIGAAAASAADTVVVTAERMLVDEPPDPSPALVEAANGGAATVEVVPERRGAIAAALGASGSRDVVVLLGRGDRGTPLFERSGEAIIATDAELAGALLERS
jgi:UDP-N-acetylmuramoylalanine--D-glutamate ligase